jgi:hypothetical protein
MSRVRHLLFGLVLVLPAAAWGIPAPAKKSHAVKAPAPPAPVPAASSLLPDAFAGWQISGQPDLSTSAAQADPADANVLREYGFARYEAATYTRGAETASIHAIQFQDATGAYGSFTFFRRPAMQPVTIGQGAAFDGKRVLFWTGDTLIDATFSRISPMSASELRDLAAQLPKPLGNLATPPSLPRYLPDEHLQPMTIRYAIGPDAYTHSGGVLPASLVDFGRSAEVVTAQYDSIYGPGTLTIINYPNSDIAREQEKRIEDFLTSHGASAHGSAAWTPALASSNPAALQSRRSGPLVVVTSGALSDGAASNLLQLVHYEVNLTISNSKHAVSDAVKVAQLILSVAFLVGIFAVIAIVAAVSLGGGRAAWKKFRRKPGAPEEDETEFIRLDLRN